MIPMIELWYAISVFIPFILIGELATFFFRAPSTELLTLISFGFVLVALVNKDFFNGQSVVHRKFGYQVLDITTNEPANRIKCMLRNTTTIVWPIEVIFLILNPHRRLGDFIAGTRLTEIEPSNPRSILTEIRNLKFDSQAILTLLYSLLWLTAFWIILYAKSRLL
jgi:hypothetical protein